MVIPPFTFGRAPAIVFGAGSRGRIPEIARSFGRRLLLVTGARSLRESPLWKPLEEALARAGLAWVSIPIEGEPSPDLVDQAVLGHRGAEVGVVLAVGGGSVLDAGKAIAALLRSGRSVMDHLEIVGRGVPYEGPATPLIAVPTTAGTGSEATQNAVLSVRGPHGFKRSFRHEALVPRCAVVDPDLLRTCPREVIAADGMDALTQLLESYVSPRASAMTDALVESGLAATREGLLGWYEGSGDGAAARTCMAYAALISGIALAQSGLGAVHGLAASLGAFFPVPHGVACGTLLAEATAKNLAALRARASSSPAMTKYARASEILSGGEGGEGDEADRLVDLLRDWTARLSIPRLSSFGVEAGDLDRVVEKSGGGSMRTNPVVLEDEELQAILRERL